MYMYYIHKGSVLLTCGDKAVVPAAESFRDDGPF